MGYLSRSTISRRVCELLNWRNPQGILREGSCRKALVKLERHGLLRLPAVTANYAFEQRRSATPEIVVPEVIASLRDLGSVDLVAIDKRRSRDAQVWSALLSRYHYLGSGPLCGARLRYLVRSERFGYIGALAFSSATFTLHNRDEYIGWSEDARLANLNAVVLNSRFLILPSVHVPHLASHVLSLALRRIEPDWRQRYGIAPVLAETFVDPTRFDGTCYKAANWVYVGVSAGRRDGVKKDIYLYPLTHDWRERLCKAPAIVLGAGVRSHEPADWAQQEFGTSRLYDERLKQRLYAIAQDFYSSPLANVPEACGSYAATKGAYRFFSNSKISMDVVLTPHIESTIERMRKHPVVLAPQDTTTLNYYTHPSTDGLGPVNTNDDSAIGMLLHDTLAFTPEGTPLGVIDAQCWARDCDDVHKSERRKLLPIEQKESMKWLRSFRKLAEIKKLCPETMLVSIGDRESDIYDLFVEACKDADGPMLLVRADKNRNRVVRQDDTTEADSACDYLWSHMSTRQLAGMLQIHIPRREEKKARDAQVQLRFSQVTLIPPKKSSHPPLCDIWAVYLLEADNPDVESRIEWMLLTTVAVRNFEDAKQRVEWYSGRWGIEIYHRTLKSGCRIKDRQLGTADRLQACLGVDMVVAWRIYHLTMLGREVPEHPCTVFFEDAEWKALCCYADKTPMPPATPPTLADAIRMVGRIGGHLGRKSDGMPGTECIWRGIQRLDIAIDMYTIFTGESPPVIRRSYCDAMQTGP